MTSSTTLHPWMAPVVPRISASSGLPLAPPKAAPCVLDLLGHERPQGYTAAKEAI
jgi:hypothetical protein